MQEHREWGKEIELSAKGTDRPYWVVVHIFRKEREYKWSAELGDFLLAGWVCEVR
jgi:hypothetical protein